MAVDLTKDTGCYASCLTANIENLYQIANDSYTPKDKFVDYIIELIGPAFYNKEAKPRFINDIRHCRTKQSVLERCLKAISNATWYRA